MFEILRNTEDRPKVLYLPEGKFFFVIIEFLGGKNELS